MEINLNRGYWDSEFKIETKTNEGSFKIITADWYSNGLCRNYTGITFVTDNGNFTVKDNKIANIGSKHNYSLGNFIMSIMLENGIKTTLEEESNNTEYGYTYILKYEKPSKKLKKIMDNLKKLPSTKSELRFNNFKSISDSKIIVEYNGHEVSGSYTYDYEVAPSYIDTLQVESNRSVKWNGRRSGGIGSDIYEFTIFLNKIISKKQEKEIIKGKKYHIDSTSSAGRQSEYAFRTSPGVIWAMMYSISEKINEGKIDIPKMQVKDNEVIFNGEKLFKILIPAWEKDDSRPNSGRTHYKGTFDLYINEHDFEEKYLELFGLKNNCEAKIIYPSSASPYIKMMTDDGEDNRKIGYL